MSRKLLFPVLCTIGAAIAIIFILNITPPDVSVPGPPADTVSPQPTTPIPSIYEIKLTDGNVCLYAFDDEGSELDRKTLGYIDIHSLQEFLLDKLRTGAKFESREAAARFIQDLDS